MATKLTFREEAKAKLLKGVKIMAEAVGTTLGPLGKNVAIDRGYEVTSVHDGVTVAKAIDLKDPIEFMGARILREAAQRQVEQVGDGTTVVTLLGQALIEESQKVLVSGINPMTLRKGLEGGKDKLVDELTKIATPVKTLEEKIQIATISAEEDSLGKMIGETIDKIGIEGVITVEDSKTAETFIEFQDGMQFENGFISYEFITDPTRLEATVENADVLISERNVTNILEILPFLEKYGQAGNRNLVIIAPDVTDSALMSFVMTKKNGQMNLICIKAPSFGDKQKDWLQDIAVLTGAGIVSDAAGMRYENLALDILGKADRITSDKDTTLIVGGQGDKSAIDARVAALRNALEDEESDFEQEKLRERIGKLTGGVAVIKVGGHTEVEMKERKERAIDAINATRAAVEEGVVAGGEVVYLRVRKVLDTNNIAENILYNALEKPFDKLVTNAGLEAPVERSRVMYSETNTMGIDVTTGELVDLIETGIIDPVKVSKAALNNAVSVAVQLITIDATITLEVEEKTDATSRS